MPTYEYICRACEHQFELFQSMSEPVKRKCPVCGKPKLERLIGAGAGVIFRGGGFYQTDYRSDGYKKAAEAESRPVTEKSAADKKPGSTEGASAPGSGASTSAAKESK